MRCARCGSGVSAAEQDAAKLVGSTKDWLPAKVGANSPAARELSLENPESALPGTGVTILGIRHETERNLGAINSVLQKMKH